MPINIDDFAFDLCSYWVYLSGKKGKQYQKAVSNFPNPVLRVQKELNKNLLEINFKFARRDSDFGRSHTFEKWRSPVCIQTIQPQCSCHGGGIFAQDVLALGSLRPLSRASKPAAGRA